MPGVIDPDLGAVLGLASQADQEGSVSITMKPALMQVMACGDGANLLRVRRVLRNEKRPLG